MHECFLEDIAKVKYWLKKKTACSTIFLFSVFRFNLGVLFSLARAKRSWKLPASLLGVLQAGKWKAISVATQTGTILFTLTLYSLNNWLYKLLTQIFVSQYRFPYAVQLAFAQVTGGMAVLYSSSGVVFPSPVHVFAHSRLPVGWLIRCVIGLMLLLCHCVGYTIKQ